MVKFGATLKEKAIPGWERHYINYKQLKKRLKHPELIDSKRARRLSLTLSTSQERTFIEFLDKELEKVVLFFLDKQGELARDMEVQIQKMETVSSIDIYRIDELWQAFNRLGERLVLLLNYLELNNTGLRKILKKYDKNHPYAKISKQYLSTRYNAENSHVAQLNSFDGISALNLSILQSLFYLHTFKRNGDQLKPEEHQIIELYRAAPVLNKIFVARKKLRTATTYIDAFSAKAGIFDEAKDEEDIEDHFRRTKTSSLSIFLNMLSTFLYMTNYYIVAPTSGDYAEKLGATPAVSGLIIGMSPMAGLFSAILYSWWSNKSFRLPLIFSSVCLVVGNLLYGLALTYSSLNMVLAGRLLTGFGGARAVNRRYIADNIPKEIRTIESAKFVTASALGMSAGPAMSAVLSLFPTYHLLGVIKVDKETSPGWLMFILWIIYLIAIIFLFEEPQRKISDHLFALGSDTQGGDSYHDGGRVEEHRPLLLSQRGEEKEMRRKTKGVIRTVVTNRAILLSLWLYVVIKLSCELMLSSTALVTWYYFHWSPANSGTYLAILGLLMFPVNYLVVWATPHYDDRQILWFNLWVMLVGCLFMIPLSAVNYTVIQYVLGSVMVFVTSNTIEGVVMSLLSKIMPKRLAQGTFNSGFLTTEAGMLGRAVGDVAVTVGGLAGVNYILFNTFAPMTLISAVTTAATWWTYEELAEDADDASERSSEDSSVTSADHGLPK